MGTERLFYSLDGVEYVSVIVADNYAFADACLAAWQALDGKDRRWLLQSHAISCPRSLLPAAREILAKRASEVRKRP